LVGKEELEGEGKRGEIEVTDLNPPISFLIKLAYVIKKIFLR